MSADVGIDEQVVAEERYGVAPRLTVVDGFRFGCGLTLAFAAFGFMLVILAATILLLALLLNFPLPFGLAPAAS